MEDNINASIDELKRKKLPGGVGRAEPKRKSLKKISVLSFCPNGGGSYPRDVRDVYSELRVSE